MSGNVQRINDLVVETYPAERNAGRAYLPPFLFVHGAAHNHRLWRFWQVQLAQEGVESHAVSLRGHPPSGSKVRHATAEGYVADVQTVVQELGLDRNLILVGHSMGGLIAQIYAHHQPVRGLILIGSWSPSRAQQAVRRASRPISREFPLASQLALISPKLLFGNAKFAVKYLIPGASQQVRQQFLQEVLCHETRSLMRWQRGLERGGFRDVQTSHILALRGEHDPLCGAEDLAALERDYGEKIATQTIPGGGHDFMYSHPGAAKSILDFAELCALPGQEETPDVH